MRRKITKRLVDSIQATDRDRTCWDLELTCFGLRCRKGGGKFYVVKYRSGGRQRWYTVGRHGAPWTPDNARREAKRILGQVAAGHDPAKARDRGRYRPSVSSLCDRFLQEYAAEHKKPASQEADERNIRNHIKPLLGTLAVADVTMEDVDRCKRAVKEGRTARDEYIGPRARSIVRGGPVIANRCLALLSKAFNLAERWGWRPSGSNPVRHVELYRERKRERFLSELYPKVGDGMR